MDIEHATESGSPFLTGAALLCSPGDDPPRDRTSELRMLGFPTRHLGPVQMTTDTALGVTKAVVIDKGKLPLVRKPLPLFQKLITVFGQFRLMPFLIM